MDVFKKCMVCYQSPSVISTEIKLKTCFLTYIEDAHLILDSNLFITLSRLINHRFELLLSFTKNSYITFYVGISDEESVFLF